jgi:hypothetical protein
MIQGCSTLFPRDEGAAAHLHIAPRRACQARRRSPPPCRKKSISVWTLSSEAPQFRPCSGQASSTHVSPSEAALGAERAAVTVESLISEAEQARRGAMEAGQYAAAVVAVKEKGRVERQAGGAA